MEYTLKSGNVEINKIKAIRPQIIVTGTVDKPYYEILYYDTSDNVWHIGYSSYNLANVIKWKQECFEVDGEIEDMEEVKHGKWIDKFNGRFVNPTYRCSVCDGIALDEEFKNELDQIKSRQALTAYCPHCGAKMDVRYAE